MAGSEWETLLVAQHSSEPGPNVLVLGGVHGNEPGGWLAAEEIAEWMPARGSLIVIPRANAVATRLLERTLPELGDMVVALIHGDDPARPALSLSVMYRRR